MIKRILIALLIAIIYPSNTICDDENEYKVRDLLTNFFIDEDKLENLVTLRFGYGIIDTELGFIGDDGIATSYNARIDYGFSRIKEYKTYPDLFSHSSEFTFISNISSHLKPRNIPKDGLTLDAWRFGFGIKNGMGYNLNNGGKVFLSHASSIAWTRIDFEVISHNQRDAKKQLIFDEVMKFGNVYCGGIDYRLADFLNFSAEYEHSLVYENFTYSEYLGAWMTDNILQRWIDFLDPILIKEFGNNYPAMKWFYKNAVSILLSEIRSQRSTFPFASHPSLSFRGFNITLTLLL